MPIPKPKPERFPILAEAPVPPARETEFPGQRPLIRPNLAVRSVAGRQTAVYGHGSALTTRSVQVGSAHEDSSHAEVFYFQKQIQAQTRMIVVLENGEHIEGAIEWYDRYAIKLRSLGSSNGQKNGHSGGRTRVLIYKDSIRYIYKAGENAPQTMS